MKKALGFATNILFFVLIIVLIALMVSYTLSFVSKLFPEDYIKQWGTLAIFDIGAVIWFMVFLFKAKGAGQRGTALLGLVVDFIGSLIIVAAEVFTAAETYLTDPGQAAWLRETATYVLVIWLGVNIALTYIYHITDPKQQEEMRARNIQDEITSKALDMAEAKVNQISASLADELSETMKMSVLASLNITNPALLPKQLDAQPTDKNKRKWIVIPRKHAYASEAESLAADQATRESVGATSEDDPSSILQDEYKDDKKSNPTRQQRG